MSTEEIIFIAAVAFMVTMMSLYWMNYD